MKIVAHFKTAQDVKKYLKAVGECTDWTWKSGLKPTNYFGWNFSFNFYQNKGGFYIDFENNFGHGSINVSGRGKEIIHFEDAILELKNKKMLDVTAGDSVVLDLEKMKKRKDWDLVSRFYQVDFYDKSKGYKMTCKVLNVWDSSICIETPHSDSDGSKHEVIQADLISKVIKEKTKKQEELKEGDIVYVSNASEEEALKEKRERILLRKCSDATMCVASGYENYYKEGRAFFTSTFKYAVPAPKEQPKKKVTLELTEEQLEKIKEIINK